MLKLTLSLFVKKFGLIATLLSKVGITSKQPTEQPYYSITLLFYPQDQTFVCNSVITH